MKDGDEDMGKAENGIVIVLDIARSFDSLKH